MEQVKTSLSSGLLPVEGSASAEPRSTIQADSFLKKMGLCVLVLLALPYIVLSDDEAATSNLTRRAGFDTCFGCICEAASRCDRNAGCDEHGTCGLFQITKPYWIDGGTPVLVGDSVTSEGAFERCVTDVSCALETVKGYMNRYSKDCNLNGKIDCHDYALLHHLGVGCEGKPSPMYIQEFDNCRYKLLLLENPVV